MLSRLNLPPSDHLLKKRYDWAYLAIFSSVLITYAIWLGSMWAYDDWYDDPFKHIAKIGSMGTTMLFCWSFILVSRTSLLDRVIGGLDKAYHVHSAIGKIAFGLIFLHPIFLAAHRLPDGHAYLAYFGFSDDIVRNTGIVALLIFGLLVALTLWLSLSRHLWKATHNFFGALMLLVVWHLVVANGEIMRYPLLGAWMFMWIAFAAVSFAYIRFLYHFFGPLYRYRLTESNERGDVLEMEFEPVNKRRRLRHRPGQYVWMDLVTNQVRQEPHPFTISSGSDSPRLRFAIKGLGDWTKRLKEVPVGTIAQFWGPYGVLALPVLDDPKRPTVLIAGGMGITPFVGMLEDVEFAAIDRAPIHLFYGVETEADAYYAGELREIAGRVDFLTLHIHPAVDKGFLTVEHIREQVKTLAENDFVICGPGPMIDALKEQLLEAEVPREQIYTEDFSAL